MEKLTNEKLDQLGVKLYMVEPSTRTFGGIVITKDTEFEDVEEVDNTIEENGNFRKIRIEQTLKDFILTTNITSSLKIDAYETEETKKTVQDLNSLNKEKLLLIFTGEDGWGVPDRKLIRPEEAIKHLELIKNK